MYEDRISILEEQQNARMKRLNAVRDRVRTLECPRCHSEPNEPCVGVKGYRLSNHQSRLDAAVIAGIVIRRNGFLIPMDWQRHEG